MSDSQPDLAWREVDHQAIAHNVALLAERCAPADLMVVLKANAYSHGAAHVARTALASGARMLGVATLAEAFELRDAGVDAPLLAWLAAPGADFASAIGRDIDVAAYSIEQLAEITSAATTAGRTARVHLKCETGMWRGGAADQWPALVEAARRAEANGIIEVVGVWSHLACADEPANPANDAQLRAFTDAVQIATDAGLTPRWRHLANSAATLTRPDMHFDMVRCGLAIYGVDPTLERGFTRDLRPALTVRARTVLTKRAPAGVGVSYGHEYRTPHATTLALVPLGYADGVPLMRSPARPAGWNGHALRLAGRVCMDQIVLDVDAHPVATGDPITIMGDGNDGEFTALDWADAAGRSGYDMLTTWERRRLPVVHRGFAG